MSWLVQHPVHSHQCWCTRPHTQAPQSCNSMRIRRSPANSGISTQYINLNLSHLKRVNTWVNSRPCSSRLSEHMRTCSSKSSVNPSSESMDLYVSIVSASSWKQLYDIFYDHRNAPSHQHCYGILVQLMEVLPETQQTPSGATPLSLLSSNPDSSSNGRSWAAAVARGTGGVAGKWESMWQALTAGGKVHTPSEVKALKALIRDVLRAVQVQMQQYSPQELLDLLEAALQLSTPSSLWFQSWEAALQPHLKHLQLQQLMRAAEGVMACGHKPAKPWAGLWFVALQPHLSACSSHQLALISLALRSWGCKPPLSWTEQYLESLQTAMTQNNTSLLELLAVLGAAVSMGLKPAAAWLSAFEAASRGWLSSCPPAQLVSVLQGLQLLGHKASAAWLEVYLDAVHEGLREWDMRSLGSMMLVLGQQPEGQAALQRHDSRSSKCSDSSRSMNGNGDNKSDGIRSSSSNSAGLLAAIVSHTEPLIEQTSDPGVLINLLCGYHAVHYTPPDSYLDLLLDEAAIRLVDSSAALRARFYPDSPAATATGSNRSPGSNIGTAGPASSNSSSSGSGSATQQPASTDASNGEDEQLWLLEAGSYKPDRNINLGSARKHLEESWNMYSTTNSVDLPASSSDSSGDSIDSRGSASESANSAGSNSSIGSKSLFHGDVGATGPAAAAAAAAAAAGVSGSLQASALVVAQVLQLLSVVDDMKLPVERSWVAEVLGALKSHCVMVDLPELQLLLELCQRFGVVLDPERVDELLVKSHVDYSKLQPEDQLRLLSLLAASQTRPNNIWWQTFLATLQTSLNQHTPAQLVMLLISLSEMGGRPPQAWLAAHESALLTNDARSNSDEALSPEGWLLLLECYARMMYKPSEQFQSAFERYMAGVLGPQSSLTPGGLGSLVGSAARLQLACSPQLEEGLISTLNKVLQHASSADLQQLVQGLLLLELQLPTPTLRRLCDQAQPHLAAFTPTATCCLLQLLAVAGAYPPSPSWLSQALEGLAPQLASMEALSALMLLQSLKAFRAEPPQHFMEALQQQLVILTPKFDAMGVATMLQGLAACNCMAGPELQLVIAGHIKKGLARPSQGMGATPLWLILEVVVQMPAAAASPIFLDELLKQASQELSLEGAVRGSKMVQRLLPHLAAAVAPGGGWGLDYTPPPGFCSALALATMEDPSLLNPRLWLDLLLRFSSGDLVGYRPTVAWVQCAVMQVVRSWNQSTSDQASCWAAAPAEQLAAFITAVGQLQQQRGFTPVVELPGWPGEALQKLTTVLGELNGHQIAVTVVGLTQLLVTAEQAAAASSGTAGTFSSISSRDSSTDDYYTRGTSGWHQQIIAGMTVTAPQLLAAVEAVLAPQLTSMSANDLAAVIYSMQQMQYTPSPTWLRGWTAAVVSQLPGASGPSAVVCLAAVAAFQAQPDAAVLEQLLHHCQQHLGDLQLPELLALGRSLQLLGYRVDDGLLTSLARAGGAQVEKLGGGSLDSLSPAASRLRKAAAIELEKVLVGLHLQG